jgi:ABC-type lipoprotein export system ATPase subunit
VGQLLLELHAEENNVLVVVTHSQELADTFPRVLAMEDGTLRASAAPAAGAGDAIRLPPAASPGP